MIEIRRLVDAEAEAFWDLRLRGLTEDRRAFAESADEHRATPVATFAERLRSQESFVIGAFDAAQLVGVAGFYRQERRKRRHKGLIWGMFVAPEYRGRGIGRALITRIIEEARRINGVTRLVLSVSSTQPAARALYVSCGFKSYGLEPEALFDEGEYTDEEFLSLRL